MVPGCHSYSIESSFSDIELASFSCSYSTAENLLARDDDPVKILGKDRFDVVIDLAAGPSWPGLLEILKPGGRHVVSGAVAGPMVELDIRTLYLKDLTLLGCTRLDPGVFNLLSGN